MSQCSALASGYPVDEHHEFVGAEIILAAAVSKRSEEKDAELRRVLQREELRHRERFFDGVGGLLEFVRQQGQSAALDDFIHIACGGRLRFGGERG
jgi:hypothetical protein